MWITMSAAIGAVAASGDEGRASDSLLLWMKAHYRLPQRVRQRYIRTPASCRCSFST